MTTLTITAQSDFELPLAEAARKQCLYESVLSSKGDNQSKLWVITPNSCKQIKHMNVEITLMTKIQFILNINKLNNFDEINFVGNIGLYPLLVGIFFKKDKYITIADGGLFSLRKNRFFIKKLTIFLYYFFDEFRVYTNYQKNLLLTANKKYEKKIKIIKPIVPSRNINSRTLHRKTFSVLYMGYINEAKGADVLVSCIKSLIPKYPNIVFTIALSGQKNDRSIYNDLLNIKKIYNKNIVIKGKVNPYQELMASDLYYYCFKRHSGTNAFPLSLYESLQVSTPIIGPNLDGVREYFHESLLVSPYDKDSIIKKIKKVYNSRIIDREVMKKNLIDLDGRVRKIDFL